MIVHTVIAMTIQSVLIGLTGNLWLGAVAASFFFFAREFTQAEYRWIAEYGLGRRDNMEWWRPLTREAWTRKGMLDWVVPSLVVYAIAFFGG